MNFGGDRTPYMRVKEGINVVTLRVKATTFGHHITMRTSRSSDLLSQGRTPRMKGVGMLVVSLRGVNFGFWSHLGCSAQNAIIFSHEGLV